MYANQCVLLFLFVFIADNLFVFFFRLPFFSFFSSLCFRLQSSDRTYCGKCKVKNDDPDDSFCFSCGAPLDRKKELEPPRSPSVAVKGRVFGRRTSKGTIGGLAEDTLPEAEPPKSPNLGRYQTETATMLSQGRTPKFGRRTSKGSIGGLSEDLLSVSPTKNVPVTTLLSVATPAATSSDHQSVSPRGPRPAVKERGSKLVKISPRSRAAQAETPKKGSNSVSIFMEVEVEETIHEVFHPDSHSGFVLLGYQEDNQTLELQACGEGTMTGVLEFLSDTEQQYIMMRVPLPGAGTIKTRDVLIVWQGPKIPIMKRGRFNEHLPFVQSKLAPVHAQLTAKSRSGLTDENVIQRSDPLSGSHEL